MSEPVTPSADVLIKLGHIAQHVDQSEANINWPIVRLLLADASVSAWLDQMHEGGMLFIERPRALSRT